MLNICHGITESSSVWLIPWKLNAVVALENRKTYFNLTY